ncbi:uncharacterized protein LOC132277429 [Cornus florida]|uniref:uncharacterized protein LOC132277429 n=1 Tax=Cornus florida TaxID=4283 RepID=UPI00289C49C6|nr:uncharacterized protein LOC132277429 [Cornus florida]
MKRRIGSVNALHQQSASIQIKFARIDLLRVQVPYKDPLVVSLTVAECLVRRVLIDPGSSANVMPRITFNQLEIKTEKLKPTRNPLLRFNKKWVEPIGMVELPLQAAERVLIESFVIDPYKLDKTIRVGLGLAEGEKQQLIDFLSQNADVFAWSHSDMPGISPSVSCHSLNVDSNAKPVRQKQRRFALERNQIITDEKKNGKWRVCIDFTNLNKACSKDSFPLPKIDQMVDATTGYEQLTFLDAYSGYNQIPMDPNVEEKTSFVSERGIYCYKVISFRLKNAGATYQRLVSKIFKNQMGKTVEAYINDMVVKSKKKDDNLEHLQDVFGVLRRYGMKLNLTKCSFGVGFGQFLGHVVNNKGIEVSPAQADALIKKAEPRTVKEVQALTGRIAALSRFISNPSDCCKPFFDTTRRHGKQAWGDEQQQVLTSLKEYIQNPPLLSAPELGEKLFMYLGVSSITTSAVLVRCEEGIGIKLQMPEGTTLSQVVRLKFSVTNNEAEYEALLARLKMARELKVKSLVTFSDSQLIIRQVTGEYGTKDEIMEAYHFAVLREVKDFDQIKFVQLPREYNEDADRLACSASSSGETLVRVILVDVLSQPSIFGESSRLDPWQINVILYEPTWIDPIMNFIRDGVLPERKDEARKIRSNVAKYAIVHNQLYRWSFSGSYSKYVTPIETRQILQTIHEGVCGNHSGGRSLAHKAMT